MLLLGSVYRDSPAHKPQPRPKPANLRENCLVQTTEWSACSKTCGMGISTRVTNDNAQCRLEKESRLCLVRHCESPWETRIKVVCGPPGGLGESGLGRGVRAARQQRTLLCSGSDHWSCWLRGCAWDLLPGSHSFVASTSRAGRTQGPCRPSLHTLNGKGQGSVKSLVLIEVANLNLGCATSTRR